MGSFVVLVLFRYRVDCGYQTISFLCGAICILVLEVLLN